MSILKKTEVHRRICPVIFLLDTSGSMDGAPIGAVNAALEGVLPELVSMNDDNSDTQIELAIMTFNSGTRWVTGSGGLVDPAGLAWNDLDASGYTAMGAAFAKLNSILSEEKSEGGFMNAITGSVAPVLFLLSDGEPTDDYGTSLQSLRENFWYKVAIRVAIGYGDANDAVLTEFTQNTETVLHTNDPRELKKLIEFVTITSSTVASKGGSKKGQPNAAADPQAANDMTNVLAEELKSNPPSLDNDDDDF